MNYELIKNEDALNVFIEWLPDLEENEKFYVSLFARKKYAREGVKASDKAQLKRFMTDKKRMVEKIRQLEAAVGSYRLGDNPAPQEALAIYINPNPRDLRRAAFDSIVELTKNLQKNKPRMNPHQEVMSCIQRATGTVHFLDFDIDTRDFDFSKLSQCINTDCLEVIETRGGYHLLVRVKQIDPQYNKTYYREICALGVDQTGDQLLPIVGCTQGGFVPRIINFSEV